MVVYGENNLCMTNFPFYKSTYSIKKIVFLDMFPSSFQPFNTIPPIMISFIHCFLSLHSQFQTIMELSLRFVYPNLKKLGRKSSLILNLIHLFLILRVYATFFKSNHSIIDGFSRLQLRDLHNGFYI